MSDSSDNLRKSIIGISRKLDNSIAGALEKAGHSVVERPNQTQFASRIIHLGDRVNFKFEFSGDNASVVARPIDALLDQNLTTERRGNTEQDRTIFAQGTKDQADKTAEILHTFEDALAHGGQENIEEMLVFAIELEHATPCKVILQFDFEDGTIVPKVNNIVTEPHSPLLDIAEGHQGLGLKDHGFWRDSNLKPMGNDGIQIIANTPEGHEFLMNETQKLFAEKLPAPDKDDSGRHQLEFIPT